MRVRIYRYDAYGITVEGTGNVANKYQFAGEQYDSSLGDYYLRARYYGTNTGRFTRRDTYEGRLSEPLTLHKYLYTHANPVNGIDPTGLMEFSLQGLSLAEKIGIALIAIATIGWVAKSIYDTQAHQPETLGGFNEGNRPRTVLDGLFAWRNTWTPTPLEGFGAGSQPSLPTHTGHPADVVDLAQYIFESSFRGPAAKDFDWTHITNNHSEWGKVAQQSGKKDIFYGLTEAGIKRAVMNAWKNREKLETQDDFIKGERRIKYNGIDPETGYIVEMWFNQNTKTVETAYPIGKN